MKLNLFFESDIPYTKLLYDLFIRLWIACHKIVLLIVGNFRYETVPRGKEQFDLWRHVLGVSAQRRVHHSGFLLFDLWLNLVSQFYYLAHTFSSRIVSHLKLYLQTLVFFLDMQLYKIF